MPRLVLVVNHAGFFLSHRLPIALAARREGLDVHVATPASKHVQRIIDHGFQWHPIRLHRSTLNLFGELMTIADLVRLYRTLRPDVVHHVTTKPVLYGTVAARLARVPNVVNALAGLGYLFGEEGGRPLLKRFARLAFAVALRHPRTRFIFQNAHDRALFVELGWIAARDAVIIPGSGVDPTEFTPAGDAPHDPIAVMFASRLLHAKGVEDFVIAAERLAGQARFIIVGEPDPDNPDSVSRNEIDGWLAGRFVEYWGRREDMPAVMRMADIFCLPTFYREGVPKVLVEAAATGLPIVTTDIPGCNDVVVDGDNGLLIPPRDAGAIVSALARLINDAELRRRMGQAGRDRVIKYFSIEHVLDQTLRLYRELLG